MLWRLWRERRTIGFAVAFVFIMHIWMFRSLMGDAKRRSENQPKILLWYKPFGLENEYIVNRETCGEDLECDVTYDRSLLGDSQAVVFHFKSADLRTMPQPRDPKQLYVWWSGEKNHNSKLKEFNDFFNLTFTYRRDSSIYAPYGSTNIILDELRKANEIDLEALLLKKRKSRKTAAWAVSNCAVQSRMKLAQDLMDAGLDVDTFGRCFDDREIGDGENTASFYEALSEYKFYFAFENGLHCKDYITEKFWYNGLRSGAVPIVWGPTKEDVAAVAPQHSFVHVDDFANVDDLVDHLFYLLGNESAYKEYLHWRTWVRRPDLIESRFRVPKEKELHSFCKLCKMIKDRERSAKRGDRLEPLVVPSLYDWWIRKDSIECIHGELFDLKVPQEGLKELLKNVLHDQTL